MKRLVKICVSLAAAAALSLSMVACGSTGGGPGDPGAPYVASYKCSKCGLPDSKISDEPAPRCCGGGMTRLPRKK